jgi:hypothetical protein
LSKPIATLDEAVPGHPRLVVELLPDQKAAVQEALDILLQAADSGAIPQIVSDALQAAAEQRYFWTPEWQAKEREADEAIAEGRVRTFDTLDQMLDFLDKQ